MSDENQSKFTDREVVAAEDQIVEQSKRIEFYLTEVRSVKVKMQN